MRRLSWGDGGRWREGKRKDLSFNFRASIAASFVLFRGERESQRTFAELDSKENATCISGV